jgi:hypothetical protein
MKRSRTELFFEAWCKLLDYLDRHKIQGRIGITFTGIIGIILAIKYTSNEIILIIEATKK